MTSPNQANLSHRKTPLRIAFYNLELSGQDAWHVRSTLTLTLALRAEHYSNRLPAGCFARMGPPLDLVGSRPDGSGLQYLVFLSTPEFRN